MEGYGEEAEARNDDGTDSESDAVGDVEVIQEEIDPGTEEGAGRVEFGALLEDAGDLV